MVMILFLKTFVKKNPWNYLCYNCEYLKDFHPMTSDLQSMIFSKKYEQRGFLEKYFRRIMCNVFRISLPRTISNVDFCENYFSRASKTWIF